MKKLALLIFMLVYAIFARAQTGNAVVLTGSANPSGACSYIFFYVQTTGNFWFCPSVWTQVTGGGGGTVNSVSGDGVLITNSLSTGAVTLTLGKAIPAGVILGTTDTQVVTNKDLTGAGNTFPTFNQNTTGSAAKWTTARNLAGNSVDGSANVPFANKFIVQGTADAGLSAAQFLGALATGILKNTTTTGVLTIAVGSDLPTSIPIASVGTAGLSGTSPVTISTAGAIGCATCGVTGTGLGQFASTTSAQLAGVISDETGTSLLVYNTSPTLVTPLLGTPTSGVITNLTGTCTACTANSATAVPAANVTAGALASTMTATTQSAKDNSTKLATTAYVDRPTGLTTGTSITLAAPRQYFICTSTCTITMPVPAAGDEFCVQNNVAVSTVITFAAIGSSSFYGKTDQSAYGTSGTGTLVSGGAVGDKMCLLGVDATHYNVASFNGTWTAN